MPANLENSAGTTGLEKLFSFQPQRNAMPKNVQIVLISHASRFMLKIFQVRLQQYVNQENPDVQAGFRKGRGIRDQTANIHWIIEKAREFQKNIYFCFIDYARAFDCVDHNKLWKILKEMGITDHLTCFPEKAIAPHSSTLAWKIPWTEEPGRLQSMESLGVGHD